MPAVQSPPKLRHRHSTGSGMQPLETSALQHGLKTMPNRIPPLPEIPPDEVSCSYALRPDTVEYSVLHVRHFLPLQFSCTIASMA